MPGSGVVLHLHSSLAYSERQLATRIARSRQWRTSAVLSKHITHIIASQWDSRMEHTTAMVLRGSILAALEDGGKLDDAEHLLAPEGFDDVVEKALSECARSIQRVRSEYASPVRLHALSPEGSSSWGLESLFEDKLESEVPLKPLLRTAGSSDYSDYGPLFSEFGVLAEHYEEGQGQSDSEKHSDDKGSSQGESNSDSQDDEKRGDYPHLFTSLERSVCPPTGCTADQKDEFVLHLHSSLSYADRQEVKRIAREKQWKTSVLMGKSITHVVAARWEQRFETVSSHVVYPAFCFARANGDETASEDDHAIRPELASGLSRTSRSCFTSSEQNIHRSVPVLENSAGQSAASRRTGRSGETTYSSSSAWQSCHSERLSSASARFAESARRRREERARVNAALGIDAEVLVSEGAANATDDRDAAVNVSERKTFEYDGEVSARSSEAHDYELEDMVRVKQLREQLSRETTPVVSGGSSLVLQAIKRSKQEEHVARCEEARRRKDERKKEAARRRMERKEEVRERKRLNAERTREAARAAKRQKTKCALVERAATEAEKEARRIEREKQQIENRREWRREQRIVKKEKRAKLARFREQRDRILEEDARERSRKLFVGKATFSDITDHASMSAMTKRQYVEKRKEAFERIFNLLSGSKVERIKWSDEKGFAFAVFTTQEAAIRVKSALETYEQRVAICKETAESLRLGGFAPQCAPLPRFYLRWPRNDSAAS